MLQLHMTFPPPKKLGANSDPGGKVELGSFGARAHSKHHAALDTAKEAG